MNRIELAERRYQELALEPSSRLPPAQRYWQMPMGQIRSWLREYVAPAVNEMQARPQFREHVAWSRSVFACGAASPERAVVEGVEASLQRAAQLLLRLSCNRLVARQLETFVRGACPPRPTLRRARGARFATGKLDESRSLAALHRNKLEELVNGAWTDLVCPADLLEPSGRMMRRSTALASAADGELIASLQPELFYVGDLVARRLVQRVRAWRSLLDEVRLYVHAALRAVGRRYEQQVADERVAWDELARRQHDLEQLCIHSEEARTRDACLTAVQVYAAYHHSPELAWLGVADGTIARHRAALRHTIESRRDWATLDRIGAALHELALLYRDMDPGRAAMETAIASGGLVIVDRTGERTVYWERQSLKVDWFRFSKPWELLLCLVVHGRRGTAISNRDLYDEYTGNSTMWNRWRRLKEKLPPTLARCVEPSQSNPVSYRLTIPSHRIHVFPSDSRGESSHGFAAARIAAG